MDFTQYIKPELLVVIPVLSVIGMLLKNSYKVLDENIPFWLGVTGVALALFYVLGTADWNVINIFMAAFTAVVQGILCTGAAVYGHQIFKQKTGGGDK